MARAECLQCRRPTALCVCGAIRRVANRTGVTIVQHPAERAHPFNTARIARLALDEVDVRIAWDGTVHPLPLPPGAALLYPRRGAPDLATLEPRHRPAHLVVIDGTWPQARTLYRENPWLQALPHVALSPDRPSAYRIRREPAAHCLSTIESIAAALALCEPDNADLDGLLDGFLALVNGQVEVRSELPARPRRPNRTRPMLIEQLRDRWRDVVVVYAETTPALGRRAHIPEDIEILQLAALRPATGERFDHVAKVHQLPDPCVVRHMDLPADVLSAAPPFEAVRERWQAFRRPDDLYVAWSWAGASAALTAVGETSSVVRLKALYCNLRRRRPGRPDQLLLREGIEPVAVAFQGRAAERIGNAAALAEWLGGQA